jgi:precorrin-6B methylase 2
MVYYQKTPVRIVFEMINKAAFKRGDVFYDLGSGLGQVTILVNLLASVTSKGVEFEPAYCEYSKTVAAGLDLENVEFINADARYADYSSGTVFFMYTPFEGKILGDVLNTLNAESKKRKIRIITYGSCTKEVARTHWLRQVSNMKDYNTAPGVFISL